MDTVKKIAKNTAVLFLAQVLGLGLGFFYMIYMARHLGAVGFGILSFALAFTTIFAIFADFGLQPLTVREVARNKTLAPKYLSNLSAMKLILSAATFGLIAVTINLLGYPQKTINVVYLVALSVVLNSFTTMLYSIFQAHERMEYQSLGHILNGTLMLAGVIFVIKSDMGVVGFASLYVLAGITCLAYSIAVLKTKFPDLFSEWSSRKLEVDRGFWKATTKEAMPFAMATFFMLIFYWIDSVMLSLIKGDAVVGWYNVAYRMVLVLLFIPHTFIAALYPVMATFHKTSENSLRSSHEKSFKYLTIIGMPIAVGTTLLARRIILLIFGAEYTNSILPLQILVWSALFIFMSITFGNLFNCLNRQAIVTKITGICVVANVVLNIILIPRYSLVGASIATVLTEFVALSLCFVWGFRIGYTVPERKLASILTRVLLSSTLMAFYVLVFRELPLLALLPSAAVVYFLTLYISKGMDKEDISLLQSAFLRK